MLVALTGCGWVSEADVDAWLAKRTCAGGATQPDAPDCTLFYEDDDADGYGGARSQCRCSANTDYPAAVPGDCDDARADVNPGSVEVCDLDLVDEDCSSATPNGDTLYYLDNDGDGYGTGDARVVCPGDQAVGYAPAPGDCNDASADVYPSADEICDGRDNDCDAGTSEDQLVSIVGGATSTDLAELLSEAPAGATIRICPGVYGPVIVDRPLTLVGVDEPSDTVIDAGGAGSALVAASADVTVQALTLTGGVGTTIGGGVVAGGGVLVTAGGSFAAIDTVITGNYVDGVGGAVYAEGFVRLEDVLVFDNAATDAGGAVYSTGDGLEIIDSNVFYNQAYRGAGLYLAGGVVDLTGTRIAGNFGDYGGGLAVTGEVTVRNGTITSNSAVAGAGIRLDASGYTLRLEDVLVSDNTVSGTTGGGGVNLVQGTLESISSDWVDDTPEDCPRANTPQDIYTRGAEYCAGDDATFTCTRDGCSGDVTTDCDCTR